MDPTLPGKPPLFIDPLEVGMGEPTTLMPVTEAVDGTPPTVPPAAPVDPDEFPASWRAWKARSLQRHPLKSLLQNNEL